MIIPTIASLVRGRDVGGAARRCARARSALGANRLQISPRVVFPAALSGIVAAFILGVSRAIGETMIVARRRRPVAEPHRSTRATPIETMTAFIAATGRATSRPARSSTRRSSRSGMLLFVITLVLNIVAIRFVRRYREVYE